MNELIYLIEEKIREYSNEAEENEGSSEGDEFYFMAEGLKEIIVHVKSDVETWNNYLDWLAQNNETEIRIINDKQQTHDLKVTGSVKTWNDVMGGTK